MCSGVIVGDVARAVFRKLNLDEIGLIGGKCLCGSPHLGLCIDIGVFGGFGSRILVCQIWPVIGIQSK